MNFVAELNGHPIEKFIKEDGVTFKTDKRVEKSVTTADGRLHKRWIEKTIIKIDFRTMDDVYFKELLSYFTVDYCMFYYTNFNLGREVRGTFYISKNDYKIKKVYANSISIIDGFSIELTEI